MSGKLLANPCPRHVGDIERRQSMASVEFPLLVLFQVTMATVLIAALWVFFARLPARLRPGTFFSVTMGPDFASSAEGLQLMGRFRWHVAAHSLIALALVSCALLVGDGDGFFLGLSTALVWVPVGSAGTYAAFHRRVLRMKEPEAETIEGVSRPRRAPLAGGWLWAGPPILAVVLGVSGWLYWAEVSHGRPTGFDISGMAVSQAPPPAGLFFVPVVGVACWSILLLVAAGLWGLRRRRTPGEPTDAPDLGPVSGIQWFFLFVAFWLAVTLGSAGQFIARFAAGLSVHPWLTLAAVSDAVVIIAVFVVYLGFSRGRQRGVLREGATAGEGAIDGDGTPDSAWKLGLYYFSPEDPSREIRTGRTLKPTTNWGHPLGALVRLGLPCLVLVFPLLFDVMLGRWQPFDTRPWIVEASPSRGAKAVDPQLAEVTFRFDQPMDPDFGAVERHGPPLPEFTGDSRWVDDRTWVLPVRLKPHRTYRLLAKAFRNSDGRAAPTSTIEFRTAGPRPATAPASE
jgi:uncharacterized membrane protein